MLVCVPPPLRACPVGASPQARPTSAGTLVYSYPSSASARAVSGALTASASGLLSPAPLAVTALNLQRATEDDCLAYELFDEVKLDHAPADPATPVSPSAGAGLAPRPSPAIPWTESGVC